MSNQIKEVNSLLISKSNLHYTQYSKNAYLKYLKIERNNRPLLFIDLDKTDLISVTIFSSYNSKGDLYYRNSCICIPKNLNENEIAAEGKKILQFKFGIYNTDCKEISNQILLVHTEFNENLMDIFKKDDKHLQHLMTANSVPLEKRERKPLIYPESNSLVEWNWSLTDKCLINNDSPTTGNEISSISIFSNLIREQDFLFQLSIYIEDFPKWNGIMEEENLNPHLPKDIIVKDLPSSSEMKSPLLEEVALEDGPVFRATLSQLEKETLTLKKQLKALIKAIEQKLEAEKSLLEADKSIFASASTISSFAPALPVLDFSHYKIRSLREDFVGQLEEIIIKPLKDIYYNDVKAAVVKRKEFEHSSNIFYTFLSKYLSTTQFVKEKKIVEVDEKYSQKKTSFDLQRFDYMSYLQDLHNKKSQEILYYFTFFLKRSYDFAIQCNMIYDSCENLMQELITKMEINSNYIMETLKSRTKQRTELVLRSSITQSQSDSYHVSRSSSQSPNQSKFKGIRDLDDRKMAMMTTPDMEHREGFLYSGVYSNDKSVRWKNYWCVVDRGKLLKYSKWKKNMKAKYILDLQCATVKESRIKDRRFCFEVISPSFHHIFQATSTEDLNQWVHTIQSSIITSLTKEKMDNSNIPVGKQSVADSNSLLKSKSSLSPQSLTDVYHFFSSMDISNNININASNVGNETFQGASASDISSDQRSLIPASFLKELYDLNPQNRYCAECGEANPEWCSTNIGILLCIECAGIHRSLGSHISKIKSLLLDSSSITFDQREFLKKTGNENANRLWEPNILPGWNKPHPDDKRDAKQKFIEAKYLHQLFI